MFIILFNLFCICKILFYICKMKFTNGYDILRTSSAPGLCGVFTKHLQTNIIAEVLSVEEYRRFTYMLKESNEVGVLYYMLVLSGCRVSELLRLRWSDVTNKGEVVIKAAKGSLSRSVYFPGLTKLFKSNNDNTGPVFGSLNYQYVYRCFIRHGVCLSGGSTSRQKVTHAPRYNKIQEIERVTGITDITKEVIGHKNIKSTRHYLRKKKP